jgi:hypothetical protein
VSPEKYSFSALIADLWWRVDLMNSDILEVEAKAGVFDVRQQTYRGLR